MSFINTHQGAARPDIEDTIGEIKHEAKFSTRVGPNRYHTYDGRVIGPINITRADVKDFVRSKTSGHALRELIKGILIEAPHLIAVKTELKMAEVMLQISPEAQKIGKASLLQLLSETPINRILQTLSMILNHDGDLERIHNDEWWTWRDAVRDLSGDPKLRHDRFMATQWTRKASMALTMTAQANDTRSQMGAIRRRFPQLSVQEMEKANPARALTRDRISDLNLAV